MIRDKRGTSPPCACCGCARQASELRQRRRQVFGATCSEWKEGRRRRVPMAPTTQSRPAWEEDAVVPAGVSERREGSSSSSSCCCCCCLPSLSLFLLLPLSRGSDLMVP
ncbi:hypothetical protein HPB50_013110 [Hyalomma asiaticum]|uniref:Uncharacterized protein n=1 Tax=Hyalomma asiaticum TaxID=266040 RepID=A0ACB7S6I2_HYAAI|nr:hypothetical protein HPB50_013110 [Hyalomma asiaticum]